MLQTGAFFGHLLRELNYLIELEATGWAKSIKTLFKQPIELKLKIPQYSKDDHRVLEIETNLNQLLNQILSKNKTPKTLTFQNSLRDYRAYLFAFLSHKDVPADNNASERGIRNFKVKLKTCLPAGRYLVHSLKSDHLLILAKKQYPCTSRIKACGTNTYTAGCVGTGI